MPLDEKACAAADQDFFAAHPELNGRQLTMEPADAKMRQEWMALYAKNEAGQKPPPPAKKPDDPVAPCPLKKKSIKGRFVETKLKCGDKGHVQAEGVNLAAGAEASFCIYRVRDSSALDSPAHPMDVASGLWQKKRPADDKKGDKYEFEVSADGVSAVSSNQLEFQGYPDYAADTKTFACSSPPFGWTGKFDISYAADTVTVKVKIKLSNRNGAKPANAGDPLPAVVKDADGNYAPVSDADKATMKADVEGKLTDKVKLFREACCFADGCTCGKPVKVVVEFVEAGQHHDVNLFTGAGRANSGNWTRVKTRANSWAHETGHLLAWYDEYTGGGVGAVARWKPNEPANIMNVGLTEPPQYCWDFRDWFAGKTGEKWKAK